MSNALKKPAALLSLALIASPCFAAPPPCKVLADKGNPNSNCVDTPRGNSGAGGADKKSSGKTKDQAQARSASGGPAGGSNKGAGPDK